MGPGERCGWVGAWKGWRSWKGCGKSVGWGSWELEWGRRGLAAVGQGRHIHRKNRSMCLNCGKIGTPSINLSIFQCTGGRVKHVHNTVPASPPSSPGLARVPKQKPRTLTSLVLVTVGSVWWWRDGGRGAEAVMSSGELGALGGQGGTGC